MTRYYEDDQYRRRHDATIGIVVTLAFGLAYALFPTQYLGRLVQEGEATKLFVGFVVIFVLVCGGCIAARRIRHHSPLDNDVDGPLQHADADSVLPPKQD